jgi:hypothetical protein
MVAMAPLSPAPSRFTIAEGAARVLSFSVGDTSRCIRVLAAGAASVHELELELTDASNQSYGRSARQNPYAMVGERGVVCLRRAGQYRASARVARGSGEIAVQAYQSE